MEPQAERYNAWLSSLKYNKLMLMRIMPFHTVNSMILNRLRDRTFTSGSSGIISKHSLLDAGAP